MAVLLGWVQKSTVNSTIMTILEPAPECLPMEQVALEAGMVYITVVRLGVAYYMCGDCESFSTADHDDAFHRLHNRNHTILTECI